MNNLKTILLKLPDEIRKPLGALPENIIDSLEEIRIQINQPVRIRAKNKEISMELNSSGKTSREIMDTVINNLLDHSIYAYETELSSGYITVEGGHRVGVCGRTVIENGTVVLIKDISSVNIRRSQEFHGIADKIMPDIIDKSGGLQNTIIVSPPKCGKTTLLRDITRALSSSGMRIGLCDERSEIAGMYQGAPSYDLGPRTDVLDGCPKAEGMMMLIRSMAPDVLVTDEIGKDKDIDALESALSAGVKIITSIHGNSYDDLMDSKMGHLVRKKIFTRIIFLSNLPSTGTVREVRYV